MNTRLKQVRLTQLAAVLSTPVAERSAAPDLVKHGSERTDLHTCARVTVLSQDHNETGLDFVIRVGTTPRQVDWTAGVLVKGVEQPPKQSRLELTDRQIAALEQSRHPTFLLVVDVRSEHLYFAWLRRPCDEGAENSVPRRVSLDPVDDASFKAHVDEIRSYYKKTPAVTPMSTLPAIPALFDEWLLVT